MLVRKTQFHGRNWKYPPQKSKSHIQKSLSDLVINQLSVYVFGSFSWKMSSNWSFQRNVGSERERALTSEHCYKWGLPNYQYFLCWIFLTFYKESMTTSNSPFYMDPLWFDLFSLQDSHQEQAQPDHHRIQGATPCGPAGEDLSPGGEKHNNILSN